ncbi:MAG: autotransporter outer membrane beta-barrel domain-containing protein [Planctomycetaceae bacterium]|nr:autotransporter outer membrane beta-barrel domain-containing protein [Planctomycetaceae bacterium]
MSSANGASVTAAADIDVAIGAGSQGTLTADGGGTNATITATDGHLTLAESGYGIMEVKAGGKVNIRDAGTGTPNAGNANFATAILGYGKGTVNGLGSELNVDQHLVVGKAGTGLLSVENEGNVKVHGNHIIADGESNGNLSFGRDVVSGNGKLTVDGDMLVGNKGNAGGRYDYIGVEYNGGGQHDPATWIGSDNLTATPKLPDGQPDPKWSGYVPINSPGLAIVEEGRVEVAKNLYAGEEETGYAYILLDNKGKPGDNILSVGENFLVADKGEAYLRIVNGSKVEVKQDMIVGNQGRNPGDFSTSGYKGHGTVRINGSDAGLQSAELNVTNDLIVGNKIGSEGYLYAHDSGKVIVGNDHYIGKETGSFGRDHFDGNNTNLQVTNTLHVGFEGTAGGHYEYRLDGSNADPDIWFDSHNLLLEPGDGDQTLVNNGVTVTKNWDTVKNNSPGLAITSGAHGDAQTIHAGIRQDSFSYILIDNKNSGMGQTTGLKAAEEMNIADAGESYVRVLNGGQLEVGSDVNGILTIAETTGQGTLRIGNTTNNTGTSHVSVIGTLITAGNGTNGDIAEGYLYANDGSTTQVIGTHIVAQGQYSFGREHFNGNGTKLIVKNDTALAISDSQTIIGGNGNAGERYRYILGGGNKNDPTIRRTEFSNNNNGKWFDSANLLLEPEQTAIGSNVNYPALTWDDVKNNSPGFALTAGATASVNDSIVANGSDSYGYVLLDNIDNDSPSATRTLWTTTGANNALILGNAGDAYARVINGSLLEVKGNMIVANEGTSEATIRINNTDGNNSAELTVSNNLTVANASGAEGNLYTYKAAKVTVGNSNTHSGDFTIAGGANSYGRVHFDGDQTIGTVGGMLTVGQGGHAGLSYIYTPHLQDSAGNFNNKINDPENWFDSINTLDDDISNSSQVTAGKNGYTINAGNISRTFIAAANNPLVKQHNAPGFLVSDGAKVTSGQGMVAAEIGSTGYAVIDNKGTHTGRSLWTINNDTLTIAEHGNAYVRVLNGALLNTTAAGGDVIIGDKNSSHGTLRVQDEGSQLAVKNDLVTGKNGTTGGQDNIAIGNFYLHNKAAAGIEGIHTIAEGIYSEGRDHIDGDGTELNINGTLTVGESGYAGNYVYHVNDSNNAKDPTNNAAEFNQWFDSANTLKDFHDSTNIGTLKENMPGLAVTAGAKVISGNGMVAKEAVTNTPTIPAEAADNLFRSNGYFVIDNAGTTAGRSEWKIIAGLGIPASAGDLIVAQEGTGYGRVINGALLDVENDMIIAERSDNGGTGRARSVGTVRVYDKDNRYDSTLNVGHNLTTAQEGTGSLYIYQGADGNVKGDHTVAELQGSYGNDHFDGHNTKLTVGGMLTVGNFGQAGGRYDYIGNGKAGGINGDPATWFDSDNTLLTQGDTGWDAVKKNTPGLAITAGAEAASGGGVVGKNRNINDGTQSYGYVVIDSKGKSVETDRSKWIVQTNNLSSNPSDNNILTVAKNGEGYVRVINGSLLEVGTKNGSGGNGTMLIGSDSYGYGTVRVNSIDPENGTRSELIVHGNLTTGGNGTNIDDYATGNLYAHDQARIQVDNNHVIAAGQYSVGRDHIDGVGTTMNVERTLTVGESGAAGGLYQENRYNIPANKDRLDVQHYYVTDPTALRDPERWLDHEARTLENLDRTLQNLGNPENAKTGNVTGNSPGLAITAGAVVTSGNGMVAQNSTANGYVLIDDKRVGADSNDDSVRTRWVVQNDGTPLGTEGQLVIGGAGNAFVRVLNGSLLQSDSTVIAQNSNEKKQGYLYVIGGKENPKDADGNPIARTDALTGKPTTWLPSEWFSKGRTVIGQEIGNERGTLRIEEGAHGVTCGLYIGLSENSQGEVSVSGTSASPHDHANATRSLLEVYEDTSPLKGSIPQGSSTLSVSDYGYLWMHQNSELRLNGVGIISNGAILHLSEDKIKLPYYSETNSPVHPLAAPNFITDPAGIFTNTPILQNQRTALVDAMESKITIVNARIEGDGTVTGEDGVFIAYDQEHDITNTQTTVDPGQRYDWNNRDEYFSYYGTLKFGDQLRMRGDVVTNFDVNSGYYAGMGGAGDDVTPQEPNCDAIIVQRGDSSTSKADVLAQLNGTLNVHARLTDYYQQQNDLLVVQTIGDTKPGSILSVYDKLKVMPHRFFDDPHQEIRQDSRKNDQLWVTLKRKNNPFEESGNTYNEKETGKGLDSVYMDQVQSGRKDWLPVLRYFWYLDNPDFLNAYRLFSGEVRAHSLLLPMTNQWRYAHNRIDFRECNNVKHNHNKPCDETQGVSHEYLRCGAAKNQWKEHLHKLAKNARLWGSIVYDDMEINNDGNAADSRLHRYGIVAGADRPFLKPESYLGVMLSINRGKLNTFQAKAQDDDFSVSLYHGTKLFEKWEWKNYLGVGVQDYNMVRNVNVNLTNLEWRAEDHYFANNPLGNFGGSLTSDFLGYTFSGSTELARPFYFGNCGEYQFRPYMALDMAMVWQNSDSEIGDFINSGLVALDYLSATNIRVYGRPGFLLERNGRRTSLHAGLSYAFLMGGRQYTNVNNRFQIGGKTFNIRGVDDGAGFVTWNFGGNFYLGKQKNCSVIFDYWGSAGSHFITQSAQLGLQKKF